MWLICDILLIFALLASNEGTFTPSVHSNMEIEDPIPAFKDAVYTTDANDDYIIDPIIIEFRKPTTDNLQVEAEPDYKKYFNWDVKTSTLSSKEPLPKETFDTVGYITMTIEAFYDKTKRTDKTIVIINAPVKKVEYPIPAFKKPIYITDANDDYIIYPITIEFQKSTSDNLKVQAEPDYKKYFNWDVTTSTLSSKEPLPKEIFDTVDYITIIIETFYDKRKGSDKTVLLVNTPKKKIEDLNGVYDHNQSLRNEL